MFQSINPTTGEIFREFPLHSKSELDARIEQAYANQTDWAKQSSSHRAKVLVEIAENLESSQQEFARLMAIEMGKPLSQGLAEVKKCAWVCRYYAENGPEMLTPRKHGYDANQHQIVHEPLGLVLAIMPWNFPFWQAFRFAAPAVLAGNGVLLKHAPNVGGCAEAIQALFDAAKPNLLTNLLVDVETTGKIIGDPRVQAVTFTGSTAAGRTVASLAGKHLKKMVLELGGSDPYIVFEDADLEWAAQSCLNARMLNTGQSCIAAKRFLVQQSICEPFHELLIEKCSELSIGDPLKDLDLGPLARLDLKEKILDQKAQALKGGVKIIFEGSNPEHGFFVAPTLLHSPKHLKDFSHQEFFGPIGVTIPFEESYDALAMANETPFGLGAAVFTKDEELAADFSLKLRCGSVAINGMVRSDPRLPFGGVKDSGFGRELAEYGLGEFVNIKTISHF